MSIRKDDETPSVRLNLTLKGDPARWLKQWKMRGLVKSNADAVRSAFREFQNVITERDIKRGQLERTRR